MDHRAALINALMSGRALITHIEECALCHLEIGKKCIEGVRLQKKADGLFELVFSHIIEFTGATRL